MALPASLLGPQGAGLTLDPDSGGVSNATAASESALRTVVKPARNRLAGHHRGPVA